MTDPTPAAVPAAAHVDEAEVQRAAGREPAPVPYSRFREVLGESSAAKAAVKAAEAAGAAADKRAAAAEAAAKAAEARVAELERSTARLGVRADLGIDDDDDADRVIGAWEKAHAEVSDRTKRPKLGEWAKSEAAAAALPKSLREAYGLGRAQEAAQEQPRRGGMPPVNRAAGQTPAHSPGGDPFAGASAEQVAAALKTGGRRTAFGNGFRARMGG
jgi:hypothetical protein